MITGYWNSRRKTKDYIEKNNGTKINDDKHCYKCGTILSRWNKNYYHAKNLNCYFCINCGKKLKRLFKNIKKKSLREIIIKYNKQIKRLNK